MLAAIRGKERVSLKVQVGHKSAVLVMAGWLVKKNTSLVVLEAEASKVRVPADLVSVQILFLAHRSLPLCVLTEQTGQERPPGPLLEGH